MTDPDATTRFPAAPVDNIVTAVTTFTLGLMFLVPAGVGFASQSVPLALTGLAIGASIAFVGFAMAPTAYELTSTSLTVRRRLWRPWQTTVTQLITIEDPTRSGLRLAGSGGFFGFYGRFRRSDIGRYRAYLTSRAADAVVSLQTAAGPLMLSPENPAAFRKAVRAALKKAS